MIGSGDSMEFSVMNALNIGNEKQCGFHPRDSHACEAMTTPPEILLQRITARQESALEEFYRMFEGRVYRYAIARLNEPLDAAEILNEVMMEVWHHAARFEGRSKVSTWLLGIAHHKVYDKLRKRSRHAWDEIDPAMPDENINTERAIAGAQNAELVKRCMENLTDEHKEVIHLAFFEDLHYRDIAGIMECPEGTVKSRVYHAKEALKRCLAKLME